MTRVVLVLVLALVTAWEGYALLTGRAETFTDAIRDIAREWPLLPLIAAVAGAVLYWHLFGPPLKGGPL